MKNDKDNNEEKDSNNDVLEDLTKEGKQVLPLNDLIEKIVQITDKL